MAHLIAMSESGSEQQNYALLRDSHTFLGTIVAGINGIPVRSPGVSAVHCHIEGKGGAYTIVNEASAGTFVNGEKVTRALLQEGDVIAIGEAKLRFTAVATEEPAAPGAAREPLQKAPAKPMAAKQPQKAEKRERPPPAPSPEKAASIPAQPAPAATIPAPEAPKPQAGAKPRPKHEPRPQAAQTVPAPPAPEEPQKRATLQPKREPEPEAKTVAAPAAKEDTPKRKATLRAKKQRQTEAKTVSAESTKDEPQKRRATLRPKKEPAKAQVDLTPAAATVAAPSSAKPVNQQQPPPMISHLLMMLDREPPMTRDAFLTCLLRASHVTVAGKTYGNFVNSDTKTKFVVAPGYRSTEMGAVTAAMLHFPTLGVAPDMKLVRFNHISGSGGRGTLITYWTSAPDGGS